MKAVFERMSLENFSCHSDVCDEFMKTAHFMLDCFKCRLLESGEGKPMTLFKYPVVAVDEKQNKIDYLDNLLTQLSNAYHHDQNINKPGVLAP